jgi:RNA polymerase sigma factor (sigma-70 family)
MAAIEATDLREGPLAPVWRVLGDEQLARAASHGNDHAFAALYARYSIALRSYCASILLNAEDAEDALQATMLKALRALPRRDGRAPLKPWLYRIAHNESIDVLRKRKAQAPMDEERLFDASAPGPHAAMARRERLAELVVDLRSLPERQRAALLMRELSGLEYDEIAGALEVTPGAVRQLVFEARSTMHEFARGRDVACSSVQRSLSDGDRRRRRARSVRAHLRACDACRAFDLSIERRGEDLAALPPFILEGTTAAAIAAVGGLFGLGGGGSVAGLVGAGAAKGIAAAAFAVAIGTGAAIESGVTPVIGHHAPKAHVIASVHRSALAAPTRVVAAPRPAAHRALARHRAAKRAAHLRTVAAPAPRPAYVQGVRTVRQRAARHIRVVAPDVRVRRATPLPLRTAAPQPAATPAPRPQPTAQPAAKPVAKLAGRVQQAVQQTLGAVQQTVQSALGQMQQILNRLLRR